MCQKRISRTMIMSTYSTLRLLNGGFLLRFHYFDKIVVRNKWFSTSMVSPGKSDPQTISNNFASADINFEKDRIRKEEGDLKPRDRITYFFLGTPRIIYASLARLSLIKFVASMSATGDVLALASAEFDISSIVKGATLTVKWRGKPVFVRHRTEEEIAEAQNTVLSSLPDPQLDKDRAPNPEWLVVVGICTHLGCVPIPNAGDYHGWFCPCHGSHYDTSGRVRKGPAPSNLEVPPYQLDAGKLVVG